MSREIEMLNGLVTVVDDEDYALLSPFKWSANMRTRSDGSVRVYAKRKVKGADGKWRQQFLHRLLLDVGAGLMVDHIDGDSLNNRRSNLRACTHAENAMNARPQGSTSSKFKGVAWHKQVRKWRVQIKVKGKDRHIGIFGDEQEAAHAYDGAAREIFGEFARTNF